MSIAQYALGVRNYLRSNLIDFYAQDEQAIIRNCKVMVDEHPTADCGQEFISIYGSYHQPRDKNLLTALDEEFGLTIAVSRKVAMIPPDYRGELGYITGKQINIEDPGDEDRFLTSWKSTEARCREIVALICGRARYEIMNDVNGYIDSDRGGPFTEPLLWLGTDPAPKQVGPEYFWGYQEFQKDSDTIFGLVQKIYLGEAIRMQPLTDLDRIPT